LTETIKDNQENKPTVTENKTWALCNSIREHGAEAHTYGIVEFVRGRKPAHARERELIREFAPTLNTH
jgi:hypothetical protein